MSDAVQELEAWIALYPHANIAQRARDEIVRLREQLDHAATMGSGFTGILAGAVSVEAKRWMREARHQVRAEALEEAALVCERLPGGAYAWCAAAIRALKDKAP
jgi:hypothetical protein